MQGPSSGQAQGRRRGLRGEATAESHDDLRAPSPVYTLHLGINSCQVKHHL